MKDLAETTGLGERQLRRKIKAAHGPFFPSLSKHDPVILVIDTTYFDVYGVMVFRCWKRRRNLLWYFVHEETNADYLAGIHELEEHGYKIQMKKPRKNRWFFCLRGAHG